MSLPYRNLHTTPYGQAWEPARSRERNAEGCVALVAFGHETTGGTCPSPTDTGHPHPGGRAWEPAPTGDTAETQQAWEYRLRVEGLRVERTPGIPLLIHSRVETLRMAGFQRLRLCCRSFAAAATSVVSLNLPRNQCRYDMNWSPPMDCNSSRDAGYMQRTIRTTPALLFWSNLPLVPVCGIGSLRHRSTWPAAGISSRKLHT